MRLADFLVVGGGVIGLSIARELKREFSDAKVVVLEKEIQCGMHASGRNSGVLHAGFYYSPDSLKAAFTRLGNKLLTEYCDSKNIAINKCGKLVVARDPGDFQSLDELIRRGRANGITIQEVNEKEAKAIEPRVKTCGRALFSPTTSTVDPIGVINAMKTDAIHEGVGVLCGIRYVKKDGSAIRTSSEVYQVGYLVNAAGLYADMIARDFGFSDKYRILPFKGLYLHSNEPVGSIRTNIYPVLDLRNPFLGVHVTVTAAGRIKIGPTAIPALWRENYKGTGNFKWTEFFEILLRSFGLFVLSNFDFKRLAVQEVAKYARSKIVSLASTLVDGVWIEDYQTWGSQGIRAQLVNITKRALEMDFVIEADNKSMYILNAVSPAFTCALPFSQYVCKRIHQLTH
jgi:(S)-2-hydroxyglutarate dehydrogenase